MAIQTDTQNNSKYDEKNIESVKKLDYWYDVDVHYAKVFGVLTQINTSNFTYLACTQILQNDRYKF
jgi:hypothetical protein